MEHFRLMANLSFKKPISTQLKNEMPKIRDEVAWLLGHCEDINAGRPNKENTRLVELTEGATHWVLTADLAIKLPLPQAVQDRLPQIRERIRWLLSFADPDEFKRAGVHICRHSEQAVCGEEQGV